MKRVSALTAVVAILAGLTLWTAPAIANTLSYSDGDFGTNWSAVQFGPTGSISAARIGTGGNPGAYWTITNNVDTTDISAVSLRSDFAFTPSILGAIQDMAFSYDAITQISGQGQGTAPALLQNGELYEVQPENAGYYTSYTSLSFTALQAVNFIAFDGSGTHPDFSATGSTIVFGFANSNTGTGFYSHRTTHSDYDNFHVTLNFVPVIGDYNHNGVVDAADYVVWRKTDGTQAGYDAWRSHFGQTAGSGAALPSVASQSVAVPEPTSIVLAILPLVSVSVSRRMVEPKVSQLIHA